MSKNLVFKAKIKSVVGYLLSLARLLVTLVDFFSLGVTPAVQGWGYYFPDTVSYWS